MRLLSGPRLLLLLAWLVCFGLVPSSRAADWAAELARMPLAHAVPELNRSNAAPLMLAAFRENPAVKGLIFMPGATDELYFFDRDVAKLTNAAPTLLDAIAAYTNQTRIAVTFKSPFLLLHSREDPLEPLIQVEHPTTWEKLARRRFTRHVLHEDAPWPVLKRQLGITLNLFLLPEPFADSANHFYRHTFAAWNLNGEEAVRAVVMAGKTKVTVQRGKLVFAPDGRFLERPEGNANRARRLREGI